MRWPGTLYLLPVGATFVGAYLLLGPARLRPSVAARVLSAPSTDGRVSSLRVVTVARLDRLEEPRAVSGLVLREGDTVLATGASDADGVAELALSRPVDGGSELVLEAGGLELARGRLPGGIAERPEPEASALPGRAEGALRVEAKLARGAVVPPFPERLWIEARGADGTPIELGRAKLTLVGASPDEVAIPLERGRGELTITPEAPRVELEVAAEVVPPGTTEGEAPAVGARGGFSSTLPAVMGGVWLDPSGLPSTARLVAPSPRRHTLVSIHDARGRVLGAVVPLREDPDGFFRGELALPACEAPPCTLSASSDALEQAQSTVAWPLVPPEGVVQPPRLGVALDGMPAALARERARVSTIRTLTIAGLSLAAAIEVFLLLRARRETEASLGRQLGEALARDAARTQRRMVAIAAALVALVFAALVAVSLR